MARNRPGPKDIIALILGASEFPLYKTLEPSPAFAASATAFVNYLRSNLAVPNAHILLLFDNPQQPGEQHGLIKQFIRERLRDNPNLTDVIFYYCGHGAYLSEDNYVLALKCTNADSKEATVLKVSYLTEIISSLTWEKRNLVVLDACYSGAAVCDFIRMSEDNAAQTVTEQFFSAVPNPEDADDDDPDDPGGAVLFCAAGPRKWAKTPLEGKYTMFSGALKAVLEEGDPKGGPSLTLKRMAQLVDKKIKRSFIEKAVTPQIHVPVQGGGDLLDSPYFPNPAFLPPIPDSPPRVKSETAHATAPQQRPSRRMLLMALMAAAVILGGTYLVIERNSSGPFYDQGGGGLPDEREAAPRYKVAADKGDAQAQAKLGYFYAEGRGGLPKDDVKAVRLYKLAADQGNAEGRGALGYFYEVGRGGLPMDDREAARLYKLSADQGSASSQTSLGRFYELGRGGLPKDAREAARLYKLAADQGFRAGKILLQRLAP